MVPWRRSQSYLEEDSSVVASNFNSSSAKEKSGN